MRLPSVPFTFYKRNSQDYSAAGFLQHGTNLILINRLGNSACMCEKEQVLDRRSDSCMAIEPVLGLAKSE